MPWSTASFCACEESGWQLPAHNAQVRDGPHEPLPDPNRPVIDLFAAETGAQLAVIASLLGDALDAANPMIRRRIDREIETRITRPYLDRHFWWIGNGDERMNNWTAWCTQNVLISTFTRPTTQVVRHAVIARPRTASTPFSRTMATTAPATRARTIIAMRRSACSGRSR